MRPAGYSLVTGASSGIGASFARALAARGQDLVLVARSKEKLAKLARELSESYSIVAEALNLDLSVTEAGSQLVAILRERARPIELLVNNAGFAARGEFWKLPLDRQAAMVRLQVEALVELTHGLLPRMIERRRGGIINVSSMTSFQPIPYASLYAATKAFATSFSMALAEEVRWYGVVVVTLCPGGTRTNLVVVGSQNGQRTFPGGPQAPEDVVQETLRTLDRGGGLVIPRLVNKAIVFSQRLLPRAMVAKAVARTSRPL